MGRKRIEFDVAAAYEMHLAGANLTEVGEHFGVSQDIVKRRFREAGYKALWGSKQIEIDVVAAYEMYETGLTLEQVGEHFGVAHHTIRSRFLDAGYEIRTKGRRRVEFDTKAGHEMYVNGATLEQVAKHFGVGVSVVVDRFREERLPVRSSGESQTRDVDVPVIKWLYSTGEWTLTELGDLYGVEHTTIRNRLRDVGVHFEPQGHVDDQGYRRVYHEGRLTKEHRVVAEQMLGRPLREGENVHHKNGQRDDNRPENLEVWNTSQPAGQLPKDKLHWSMELLELYEPEMFAALAELFPEKLAEFAAPNEGDHIVSIANSRQRDLE